MLNSVGTPAWLFMSDDILLENDSTFPRLRSLCFRFQQKLVKGTRRSLKRIKLHSTTFCFTEFGAIDFGDIATLIVVTNLY